MNTQHTPGPWTLSGGNYAIITKDGELVPVINLANARLIAAAPELLATLKEVCEWYLKVGSAYHPTPAQIQRAMAVVDKAEGK